MAPGQANRSDPAAGPSCHPYKHAGGARLLISGQNYGRGRAVFRFAGRWPCCCAGSALRCCRVHSSGPSGAELGVFTLIIICKEVHGRSSDQPVARAVYKRPAAGRRWAQRGGPSDGTDRFLRHGVAAGCVTRRVSLRAGGRYALARRDGGSIWSDRDCSRVDMTSSVSAISFC